jgi:hypothetical protein
MTGWQCVPDGTGTGTGVGAPTAQLSCEPKTVDVGMQIGFSYSCGNATASVGTGFNTGGQLAGTTTVTAASSSPSGAATTYTLTCINQGVTTSAQCQVQTTKTGIIMVTNPQKVKSGDTVTIGWITAGMKSCVISSPDQYDFTQRNANSTNPNGTAVTSAITGPTVFNLDCITQGQDTRQASTTVTLQ